MKSGIRCALTLLLLALLTSCSAPGCENRFMPKPIEIGDSKQAPDFTAPLFEGQADSVTLSNLFEKQTVLLVFWASWCPSCVEEIPILNAWEKKYGAQGLKILGVNVQETPEEMREFSRRTPIEFSVALDPEGEIAEQYGLVGLPVSIVIARGGKIIYYGFSLPQKMEQLITKGLPAGRQGVSE